MKRVEFFYISILVCFLGITSCKTIEIPSFESQPTPSLPNYNLPKNWAVLPNLYPDNLKHWQSVSSPLQADVFYIYPTLNGETNDLRWNVPVNDNIQKEKVLNKAVYFQASAFLNAGNLYVPFYRQAHLRSYKNYEKGGKEALNLAYADVKVAFEYYLKNHNNGRPIIIASHSQGTTHAITLLKEFFDNKPLQSQLVAAYIPGIAIKKDEFKTLKLMTSPDETGGFVTWNTYKRNYYPKTYALWFEGKAVSNPITWDAQTTSMRQDHKGFLYTNSKLYKKALQVEVKDGLLWTSLPHFPYRLFALNKKRYHAGDINLFWQDINENAVLRVKAYLKAH